ncbi:hypothetical protein PROVRETT_08323 [Providencia rettgeri DSM 1131]|nr:hypothetical protein PROVRETT_08323 [Providencia rettgeri DSM 1131]
MRNGMDSALRQFNLLAICCHEHSKYCGMGRIGLLSIALFVKCSVCCRCAMAP